MSRDSDDDALSWAGDDDPTLAPGWKRVGKTVPFADGGGEAPDDPDAEPDTEADSGGDPLAQIGSVELVALGVLGGVYLLYAVGWLLTAIRTDLPGQSLVGDAMYALGLWLSVLAPALWFGLVAAVVRHTMRRILWLVLGAIVLVPLPLVLGVTA